MDFDFVFFLALPIGAALALTLMPSEAWRYWVALYVGIALILLLAILTVGVVAERSFSLVPAWILWVGPMASELLVARVLYVRNQPAWIMVVGPLAYYSGALIFVVLFVNLGWLVP